MSLPWILLEFRIGRARVEVGRWLPLHVNRRPWGRVAWHVGLGFVSIVVLERADAR